MTTLRRKKDMKKSFMTRVLATGLSVAMAFSLSAATNVSVASAATAPTMAKAKFAVRVGGATKSYKASAATRKSYKITKATVGNTDKATVTVNASGKSIKVAPGTVSGSTVVKVTFKNTKTKKSTAKKFRCVVKPATEQTETPETPVVTEAVKVTAAAQKSGNTVEVTLSSAVTSAAVADFTITRDESATVISINTVAVDSTDGTKVTITTYEDMIDAKAYTVTYTASDDAKTQSSVQFTATDAVIADLAVTPLTVTAGKSTIIKYQTLDKDGVVLTERSIGNPASNIVIDTTQIDSTGSYTSAGSLYLPNAGDTATIVVTYHTYKYDSTTGLETGAISKTFTVTAVETAEAASIEYTVATSAPNWLTVKKTSQLGESDGSSYKAYIRIKDANGDVLTDTQLSEYSVESSNPAVVIASGTCDNAIALTVVNQGSANLVVSKDGSVKYTLPITVGAARYLYAVTLDQASVTVGNTDISVDTAPDMNTGVVYATAVDQYGTPLSNVDVDSSNSVEKGNYSVSNLVTTQSGADGEVKIEVASAAGITGSTGLTLSFLHDTTGTSTKATLTVKVVNNTASTSTGKYVLKAVTLTDNDSATPYATGSAVTKTFDATVKATSTVTRAAVIRAVRANSYGVVTDMNPFAEGGSAGVVSLVAIRVVNAEDSSKVYAASGDGITTVVTSSAIDEDAIEKVLKTATGTSLVVKLNSTDSTTSVTKTYLPAGKYKVTFTTKDANTGVKDTITDTFTVTNDLSASVKINATNLGKTYIDDAFDLTEFVTYTVNGVATTSDIYAGVTVDGVYGTHTTGSSSAWIEGVIVNVPVTVNSTPMTEQLYIPVKQSFYANSSTYLSNVKSKALIGRDLGN
jgi:hypothetical protein